MAFRVDEAYWGGEETGVIGRGAGEKALIIVAAEEMKGIRTPLLRTIPDASSVSLQRVHSEAIAQRSTVPTGWLESYLDYKDTFMTARYRASRRGRASTSRVHRVIALLKRCCWAAPSAIGQQHLDTYLDEFHLSISIAANPNLRQNSSIDWLNKPCR